MPTITSARNPLPRFLRSLRYADGRADSGCFLAEGPKLCEEALRDGEVVSLLIDAEKAGAFSALLARFPEAALATAEVVKAVCEAQTPQGAAAAVRLPKPLDLDAAEGALLALDGVQDPGNVGTMLRTAEAAGFSGALLSPACADAFAPKAVRASMGSVLRLPLWRGDLALGLGRLKARGTLLIAAQVRGRPVGAPPPPPFALIIGSEGRGIGGAVSALADLAVSLPMRGRAESLNAAVAAGILMYALTEPKLYADQPPV